MKSATQQQQLTASSSWWSGLTRSWRQHLQQQQQQQQPSNNIISTTTTTSTTPSHPPLVYKKKQKKSRPQSFPPAADIMSSSSTTPPAAGGSHATVLQVATSPLQAQQLAQDALKSKKLQYENYRVNWLSEAQQATIPSREDLGIDGAIRTNQNGIASSSSVMWGTKKGQSPPLPPQSWSGNLDLTPRPSLVYSLKLGTDADTSSRRTASNYRNSNNRDSRFNHPYLQPHGPGSQFPFDDPIFHPVPYPGGDGDGNDGNGRLGPGVGGGGGHNDPDGSLALLLPLLVLLSSMLFFLLIFIILVILLRRRARIILADQSGPLDIGREEELEGHGGLDGIEGRWLEGVEEAVARGYARAKEWVGVNPPASVSTDITMSQSLAIQEKGVSAWSFDPDYEDNPSVFVVGRTELTFLADGQGMAAEEGGGNCVLSNLPLPKINEVYYWEVKMFNKPDSTNVSIGLATKPYPCFRLPGWSKFSIGYFSQDGFKCHNYPFTAQSYGPSYVQGDVIGVGYRPRTGTVFFTRNGRKLEDAFVGLHRHNYFPCIGADGSAELHVNLGQAGFVFIEANVKKWGLAPSTGTLPPPPSYGMEQGSILIESGGQGSSSRSQGVTDVGDQAAAAAVANAAIARRNALRAYNNHPLPPPPSSSPPSFASVSSSSGPTPTPSGRRHRSHRSTTTRTSHSSRRPGTGTSNGSEDDRAGSSPHNPPTPHELDISLHSLRSSVPRALLERPEHEDGEEEGGEEQGGREEEGGEQRRRSPGPPSYASIVETAGPSRAGNGNGNGSNRQRSLIGRRASSRSLRRASAHSHNRSIDAADLLDAVGSNSVSQDGGAIFQGLSIDTSSASSSSLTPGASANHGGVRPGLGNRASGIASAVLGMLTERGLLTPMSADNPTARSPGGGSRVFSGSSGSSSPMLGIYGNSDNNDGFLGRGSGSGREERNSYFPTMTPAQQRAEWDRERALLTEQQAAANAAARGVVPGSGGRMPISRSGSFSARSRVESGGEGQGGEDVGDREGERRM
ncbi:hypothetical protein CF319_g1884 [Tilletia indica]|nr:hypothetical protein CF319_g1884 [Tilletia indica]